VKRREAIVLLLVTLRDVQDPLQRGTGGIGGEFGDKLLLLPNAWHEGSYSELVASLRRLRQAEPELYWHLSERYLRSLRRRARMRRSGNRWCGLRRNEAIVVGDPGGTKTGRRMAGSVTLDVLLERWDAAVRPEKVDQAIDWLALDFQGSPMLPREVYEAWAA
jgi:hypothetical protein